MKPATNRLSGVVVELARRADLLEHARAHDRDAVAERHGLGLVVGHVDRRGAQAAAGSATPRCASARAASRRGSTAARPSGTPWGRARSRGPSPRAGAGRRRGWPACGRGAAVRSSDLRRLLAPCARSRPCPPCASLSAKPMFSPHGHVRVERVVLEHHRDVAVLRRLVVDDLAADLQLAVGDVLEPGDHPQRGRLPAAGRADEDHELAVGDVEVDVLDGLEAVGVALA